MNQDAKNEKLQQDLSLLNKAGPRARAMLALTALQTHGTSFDAIGLVYGLLAFEAPIPGLARQVVQQSLYPFQALMKDSSFPVRARISRPQIRRRLIEDLQDSPLAARWRDELPTLLAAVNNGPFVVREPAVELMQRLAVLIGAGTEDFAKHFAESADALVRAALYDVFVPPISLGRVLRLHPNVALGWVGEFLRGRRDGPQRDIPALLDAAMELLRRGAQSEKALPALVDAAWMAGRDELLRHLSADAGARRRVESLTLAFASNDPKQFLESVQPLATKIPTAEDALIWGGLAGVVVHLALLAIGGDAERKRLQLASRKIPGDAVQEADGWITAAFEAHLEGRQWKAPPSHFTFSGGPDAPRLPRPLSILVLLLSHRWFAQAPLGPLRLVIEKTIDETRASGFTRMADVLFALLDPQPEAAAGPANWRTPKPAWQRMLDTLAEIARSADAEANSVKARKFSRVRAHLKGLTEYGTALIIEFYEQRPTTKGWTAGRRLSTRAQLEVVLSRIATDNDGDRGLLRALLANDSGWIGQTLSAGSSAVRQLERCSLLQAGPDERSIGVEFARPKLGMQTQPDGSIALKLTPEPIGEIPAIADLDNERLRVFKFTPEHQRIARLIQETGALPASAMPAVVAMAPALSHSVDIAAALGHAETVHEIDHRIHVLIDPLKDGLRLRLRTHPLGNQGVYLVPGAGQRELLGVRDGAPVRGVRDLKRECEALDELIERVPLLGGGGSGDAIELPETQSALETLSQLLELGDEVPLVWPSGKRWTLSKTRTNANLSLRVRSQRDWFHAEGGLALEDGSVVSLATLLEALPSSQGRFLRLDDGRILSLTQDLSRRLQGLNALADERGQIALAPVAAGALQSLIDSGIEIDVDQAFRDQLERMQTAALSEHPLPADFQAELRDYQLEGFTWMMRLAQWGAGALLADDMGLGKTVQALAVLVARAHLGPAIVIAPTSVVSNWRSEARRFAPGLAVSVYGEGDRSDTLEGLGAGSVLLISYGLLTLNIEAFTTIRFSTLVLDEAQAVKNAQAQRTQAIRQLHADARIATTGTPIENHLGELWSLMRILNPGLLGSQERFGKRFITPLERDPRAPEREMLRKLISPFLLRRMKSQVLDELPPRTEIVLMVEPSAGEAALLAAVRRQALERIAAGGVAEEGKRFHVLAELMRLRRAACHPSLVAPELNLAGAKLEQLVELVIELKENRHRALVFSQFTDYLAIVRKAFDENAISYQYLDGSTSPKNREIAVTNFQNGLGDVFLLSLKAGGVGLNLTAADYVIHLDPWWNPAVEQQATDRAHRIGQTRPVTVYKLIVKGSIEEQILSLHGSKRELVDSVLGDQDVAKALSVEELVALLA